MSSLLPALTVVEPPEPDEAESDAAERRGPVRSVVRSLAPAVGIVVFLGGWQLAIEVFDIKRFVLPSPTRVLEHINSDKSFYWDNAQTTMWEAFLGFALAFVVAMVAAAVMAHSRFVERAVVPLVVLVQVTPLVAYAPAIVIWRGFGLQSIVFMTALVCFVPFLINATAGFRSVDPNLLELARSVDASTREVFFKLRVPSALPNIFAAARIAVGLSLIGAVLGEFFGSYSGLGYAIKRAQAGNLPLQLWGSVFVLATVGALTILLIGAIERLVLRWHASQRR